MNMSDKYITLFDLGAGAFGKACVVKCKRTSKKYVAKVIQIKGLSAIALDRCVTEVAVLSACSHANIVRYIEAFVNEGSLCIVMEYASGGDLQQRIDKQNGTLFASESVLDWFLQVVMALEYIHSRNILHRDLKPQNIFLTDSGIVKLGDFGIARVLSSCEDLASTRIGTPFYISPEICRGQQYNSSSDMWSAGCLLYQMCTLHVPFHAVHFDELVGKIVKAEYAPIPSQFDDIIHQLISKLIVENPEQRLSATEIVCMTELTERVVIMKKRNTGLSRRHLFRSRSKSCSAQKTTFEPNYRSRSCTRNDVLSDVETATPLQGVVCHPTSKSKEKETVVPESDKADTVKSQCKATRDNRLNDSPAIQTLNIQKKDEKDIIKQNGRLGSLTYTIKDSVARRLSEASPTLSQTVSKQKSSLADYSPVLALHKNAMKKDSVSYEDNVFEEAGPGNSGGQVLVKDVNNNNSTKTGPVLAVNRVLFEALSLSGDKVKSSAFLRENLTYRLGAENTDQFLQKVQEILATGQTYSFIKDKLNNDEKELLPLALMYIAQKP